MNINGAKPEPEKITLHDALVRVTESLRGVEIKSIALVVDHVGSGVEVISLGAQDTLQQIGLLHLATQMVVEQCSESGLDEMPVETRVQ